jgi:colicin import membrane protein
MPNNNNSTFQNSRWLTIAMFVIAIHLGLLTIGTMWNPASSAPKLRSKVMVQTIQLKPFQTTTIQNSNPTPILTSATTKPPVSENNPLPDTIPLIAELIKEETPLKTEKALQLKSDTHEENQVVDSKSASHPTPPPSMPPHPIKKEISPQPASPPKKEVKEPQKTPSIKKTAPVKKPIKPVKKSTKSETTKVKSSAELEKKKRQQEKADAEKRQQEAEKKRQQERAETEKKRQQELAAAQEAARQRETTLLNKAKENLAKIGETRDKISSSSTSLSLETTTLPKEIGSLQVDALPVGEVGTIGEWGSKEMNYSDEVASRLKMALRLPDYGAVKIKLTLDRTGKVLKVETVQSESNKNRSYVESKIPSLLFPSFGQRFPGVSQNTFVITLQNDS